MGKRQHKTVTINIVKIKTVTYDRVLKTLRMISKVKGKSIERDMILQIIYLIRDYYSKHIKRKFILFNNKKRQSNYKMNKNARRCFS